MHNRRTDRGFEEFWDCGSHKLKGRNCGAKGSIPHAVLVKESTEVLGLDDFDEQAFLDRVEKIVVPEYHVMVFCMKNGQKLIRTGYQRRRRIAGPMSIRIVRGHG